MFANLKSFSDDPVRFIKENREKQGDIFNAYIGPKRFLFICDNKYAEHVLITKINKYSKSRLIFDKIIPITGTQGLVQLEGTQWLKWREHTGEIFNRDALQNYPEIINIYIKQALDVLETRSRLTGEIDIAELFVSYAIKSACRIFLGSSDDETALEIAKDFISLNHLCGMRMRKIMTLPLFIPTAAHRHIVFLQKRVENNLRALIHKASNNSPPFSLLKHLLIRQLDNKNSFKVICDQLMTFLFAGFETTAASLTMCFYLLAKHQENQDILRSELNLFNSEKLLSIDEIKSFPYVNAVYREALRLYPPAWILAREALTPDNILQHKVSKKDTVIICVREIQRNKNLWANPDAYMPQRFLPNTEHYLTSWRSQKCAFIPFGAGQRICSGNQLAMLEAINAIARLCKNYHFTLASSEEPRLEAHVTHHPESGLILNVKKL